MPVMFLSAGLAGVHRVVPGLVEAVVGGGGLVLSVFAAADGETCGVVLGDGGAAAVQVYGGVMLLSGLIRLLGSASPREMGRHLLVATAVLHVSLFLVGQFGNAVDPDQAGFAVPVVLLAVLFIGTIVGIRSRSGLPLLGVGLVVVTGLLALSGTECEVSPIVALAGSIIFAGVASFLDGEDDDLNPGSLWPDRAPHRV